MIDKEYIDRFMGGPRIEPEDIITLDFMSWLCDGAVSYWKMLFRSGIQPTPTWKCEILCEGCNKTEIIEVSKTRLFEIMKVKGKTDCPTCKDIRFIEELKHTKRLQEEARKKEVEQEIVKEDDYKEITSLSTRHCWKKGMSQWEKWEALNKELYNVDMEALAVMIKDMEYYDFLSTPYWKAVAGQVRKYYRYMCALCGESQGLKVHHKNYKRHGYEYQYWKEDLILLCGRCHEKHHDIKPEQKYG